MVVAKEDKKLKDKDTNEVTVKSGVKKTKENTKETPKEKNKGKTKDKEIETTIEKENEKVAKKPKEKTRGKSAKEKNVQIEDNDANVDKSVENTLVTLYKLQTIYSRIDNVRVIRGELPLEVSDLEDECLGLQVRIDKFEEIVKDYQSQVSEMQETIKRSHMQISKYKEQLDNVRNNREFDALSKEIEYEELDIQLNEKKIREYSAKINEKSVEIGILSKESEQAKTDLRLKKEELNTIVAETEKEETELLEQVKQQELKIEPRMLNAFMRIRTNMRNGLATVKVDRNACGGCFNKISPQRQLDIRMHKKIIVCEFCGRILIDDEIALTSSENIEANKVQ
jgi:predicted  nucleic acid-binding Zn-ribbon protein